MRLEKVIRQRLRQRRPGLDLVADIQCVIAVNGGPQTGRAGVGTTGDQREAGDTGPVNVASSHHKEAGQ